MIESEAPLQHRKKELKPSLMLEQKASMVLGNDLAMKVERVQLAVMRPPPCFANIPAFVMMYPRMWHEHAYRL